MQIDSDELIKYLKSGCNICEEKDTNWCERCCFVTNVVDTIESFVDTKKVNSAK